MDTTIEDSNKWHKELLYKMTDDSYGNGSVLSVDLTERLTEYMAFRHFYRHAYSFQLSWDKLQPLVINLESIWTETKKAFNEYIEINS